MANNVIGNLVVNLGLETARLKSDTDKAAKHFNGFEKKASRALNRINRSTAGLASSIVSLVGVGAMGLLIKETSKAAKEAIAYSDALGISTEALTAWQFAGQSVGLEADKISDIMKDSAEKIGDAFRNNGGEALEALEGLNLSIRDMAQLSPEKQLLEIGNALGQVGTQGEKIQILESLGNDATLLLPLLDNNAEKLKSLIQLSDETGNTMTRIEADKLVQVGVATAELDAVMKGLGQTLLTEVSPSLSKFIRQLTVGIPKAVEYAQPAFEAIGNDILNLWEYLNPSAFTGGTTLEEALLRQARLEEKIADNRGFRTGQQREDAKAELAQLSMVITMLQKKNEIMLANASNGLGNIEVKDNTVIEPVGGIDKDAEDQEKLKAALQVKLDTLTTSLLTEEGRLIESHNKRRGIIDSAFENELISDARHKDLLLAQSETFEKKLTDLQKASATERQKFESKSAKDKTSQVLGEAVRMTEGVAQKSKTMFKINKTASLANAVISGYESFNKTMAAYPYPYNIGLAALGAVATGAQISAIKSTSFGGGGSAPSLAGGGGGATTINTTQANSVGQDSKENTGSSITINIAGSAIGDENVRQVIVDAIETAQSNDEIRFLNAS